MSGLPADAANDSTGLSAEDIQSLITTEEPEWRPEAVTATDAPADAVDETDKAEPEKPAETVAAPVAPANAAEPEKPHGEKPAEAAPVTEEEEDPKYAAMAAQLALQKEHNARMSGRIGLLSDQLTKATSQRSEQSEDIDEDRATRIERRLDEDKAERTKEAVRGAVANVIATYDARPEVATLFAEIKAVGVRYQDDLEAAMSESDPARAARLTELALKAMVADAKAMKNAEARKAAETVRDASKNRVAAAKEKAAPVGRTSQATESAVPELSDSSDDDAIAANYRKRGRPGW